MRFFSKKTQDHFSEQSVDLFGGKETKELLERVQDTRALFDSVQRRKQQETTLAIEDLDENQFSPSWKKEAMRFLKKDQGLEIPESESRSTTTTEQIFVTEAYECLREILEVKNIRERIASWETSLSAFSINHPEQAILIRADINTLEIFLDLFSQGEQSLRDYYKGRLSSFSDIVEMIPSLVLGIEYMIKGVQEPSVSLRGVMDQFAASAPAFMQEAIFSKPSQIAIPEDRYGTCGTFCAQLSYLAKDSVWSKRLRSMGIASLEQRLSGGHKYLLGRTTTGEIFFWDPTIMQFVKEEENHSTSIGFIGTGDQLRQKVKQAIQRGNIQHSSIPSLAFERYWNGRGRIDREEN
ncbi:hypothetical protein A2239_02410 [Candidatus Uhrbacteria bacterium RIFOXYA2_FULL_40_9]|nr:MAG: hypothetical protein UT94_C0031G0024 [Candidatus Uhrbacteria bacterium GW2011_GWF2_40_263]OGL93918.1 MAG: hypothetical protein A2239_02410 [Candidatus Uhrbacteria bacterium RIFOXYA2_FULL_40_9]OGL97589.1 MAG: hypothetical protein A2332_01080 [Candidatus Uhrbacteria bacterium RIFOXYB2_FULL_41_18]HBK35259.1 hypothetical protein [Candidatus Uhrbacteria bacterium]HCB56108.1 hypothetical protein [Candidatus Uhrbacteria bacterium]